MLVIFKVGEFHWIWAPNIESNYFSLNILNFYRFFSEKNTQYSIEFCTLGKNIYIRKSPQKNPTLSFIEGFPIDTTIPLVLILLNFQWQNLFNRLLHHISKLQTWCNHLDECIFTHLYLWGIMSKHYQKFISKHFLLIESFPMVFKHYETTLIHPYYS